MPPLLSTTMPVIQLSVHGFASFNTFIMTIHTWWNCLSLSAVGLWLDTFVHTFSPISFTLLCYLTSYENFHNDSNQCFPSPQTVHKDSRSISAVNQHKWYNKLTRNRNFRCLTLMSAQMQQQMPWYPEDMMKQAIFWTMVMGMMLQSNKITPGKSIPLLVPQKHTFPSRFH